MTENYSWTDIEDIIDFEEKIEKLEKLKRINHTKKNIPQREKYSKFKLL